MEEEIVLGGDILIKGQAIDMKRFNILKIIGIPRTKEFTIEVFGIGSLSIEGHIPFEADYYGLDPDFSRCQRHVVNSDGGKVKIENADIVHISIQTHYVFDYVIVKITPFFSCTVERGCV